MLISLVLTALLTGPGPTLVTAAWLQRHLEEPELVVVQVAMDRSGYDAGHLPGARFAPLMAFHGHRSGDRLLPVSELTAAARALGLRRSDRIVIVGAPLEASILFVALDYLGLGDRVMVLDGGVPAWQAAGGSLSRDSVRVAPSQLSPGIRTGIVVDAGWLDSRLGRPGVALLDARSEPEYAGTSTTDQLPRHGHIPGASNLDWVRTLTGTGEGPEPELDGALFRDSGALGALFLAAGVQPGDTVVTYCTVGMRASHLYFVARLLGYEARLYVGSMADWTGRSDRPVATGPR